MGQYLNPDRVRESFDRLASRENTGKAHLERTSAVLYFLAFDAACHSTEKKILDLNPDKLEGKNNRKQLEQEFSKLVLLDIDHGQPIQYLEFGKIDAENTAPEKRISSNFLTVPLKKAATQTEPFYYPRRPNNPLLKLGTVATGKTWGMSHHEDYEKNFFIVLGSAKSSTPAYDLAVVLLRNSKIPADCDDIFDGLTKLLHQKFTQRVSDFLAQRIEKEKILVRSKLPQFIDHYSNFVKNDKHENAKEKNYELMSKEELLERVYELEAILKSKSIF